MARHRNIRSMNYDEYESYDDIYGHSVEDDFCMSPSEAAFMYDREGNKNQQRIGNFFKDISEEDEAEQIADLSDEDKAKLESCVKQLKEALGSAISRRDMVRSLLDNNFDIDRCVNALLDKGTSFIPVKPQEKKDDNTIISPKSTSVFKIPKFNTKLVPNFNKPLLGTSPLQFSPISSKIDSSESKSFTSLADLTSSHLRKVTFGQSEKINAISKNLSDLNIAKKSPSCSESSDVKIDLSTALKDSTISVKSKTSNVTIEDDFEMPFVDCDTSEDVMTSDGCVMDIKFVLDRELRIVKKASTFGKILCKKYKFRTPFVLENSVRACNLKRFRFETPSPDDVIAKFLKR